MQEFAAQHTSQTPAPLRIPYPLHKRRKRLLLTVCAGVVVVCLLATDGMLRKAALVSAGLALGPGSLLLQAAPATTAGKTEESRVIAAANNASADDQAPPKPLQSTDPKETPADIALLMKEAVKEFANQKKDGDIRARTYVAGDGTQHWGQLGVLNTTATQKGRDISKDLAAPLDLKIDKSKPAVLVFHTHTTEAFQIIDRPWYAQGDDPHTTVSAKNIVRVGDALIDTLEQAGFQVIHDKTLHDKKYTGAYDNSRATVLQYLKKYPSIQLTLDVHRDSIYANQGVHIKPLAKIDGKNAAQVMIITGVQEGAIENYPNWATNLNFAAKLQMAVQSNSPGLMRPIFFAPRKYNMDVTPYSLLLEFGSDANTLDEAVYSGRLVGQALGELLNQFAAENSPY
ncbi:MAG: stage II sporulation protein P [Oscillospiraceae bacterium]|jgi:stage II sporulation protein P|nr:stage II sporulation protein P [Oscillospiraceae bacterium]